MGLAQHKEAVGGDDRSVAIGTEWKARVSLEQIKQELQQKNWEEAKSPEERLKILQHLENYYADKQGRPACKVVLFTEKERKELEGSRGYFSNGDKQLHINGEYLDGDLRNKHVIMNTLAHEGRHAYQNYAVDNTGKTKESEQQREKWRENRVGYVEQENNFFPKKSIPYYVYRLQPLEKDANNFAKEALDRDFTNFEPGFKDYKADRDNRLKLDIIEAKRDLGDNYEAKIDLYVKKDYIKTVENNLIAQRDNMSEPQRKELNRIDTEYYALTDYFYNKIQSMDDKEVQQFKQKYVQLEEDIRKLAKEVDPKLQLDEIAVKSQPVQNRAADKLGWAYGDTKAIDRGAHIKAFLEKWIADDIGKGLGPNPFAHDLTPGKSIQR